VSVKLIREPYKGRRPIDIMNADDAYHFLKPLEEQDRESFWRLDLNCRNQLIGCEEVSKGHMSGSLVHPREVYKGAILSSAAAIIIAHNHPSGDPEPSEEDESVTDRLIEAGQLLGIPLLDHIIVGSGSYWSMAAGKCRE